MPPRFPTNATRLPSSLQTLLNANPSLFPGINSCLRCGVLEEDLILKLQTKNNRSKSSNRSSGKGESKGKGKEDGGTVNCGIQCAECNGVWYCCKDCLNGDKGSEYLNEDFDDVNDNEDNFKDEAVGHTSVVCNFVKQAVEDEINSEKLSDGDDVSNAAKSTTMVNSMNRITSELYSYPSTLSSYILTHDFYSDLIYSSSSADDGNGDITIHVVGASHGSEVWGDVVDGRWFKSNDDFDGSVSKSAAKRSKKKDNKEKERKSKSKNKDEDNSEHDDENDYANSIKSEECYLTYISAFDDILNEMNAVPALVAKPIAKSKSAKDTTTNTTTKKQRNINLIFIGPDVLQTATTESSASGSRVETLRVHPKKCIDSESGKGRLNISLVCVDCYEDYLLEKSSKTKTKKSVLPDLLVFFNPGFTCPDYTWTDALDVILKMNEKEERGVMFLGTSNTIEEGTGDMMFLQTYGYLPEFDFNSYDDDEQEEESEEPKEEQQHFLEPNTWAGDRIRQSGAFGNDLYLKNYVVFGGFLRDCGGITDGVDFGYGGGDFDEVEVSLKKRKKSKKSDVEEEEGGSAKKKTKKKKTEPKVEVEGKGKGRKNKGLI